MALSYGQKWAVYMLMGTHPSTGEDGKSQLRVSVEQAAGGSADLSGALTDAVNQQLGFKLAPGSIAPLPANFTAHQLRNSLGFAHDDYDPNLGPCPGFTNDAAKSERMDNQLAIAQALVAMQGGVPA